MEWQPIETAPKDGTPILISSPGGCVQFRHYTDLWICHFHNGRWVEAGGEHYSSCSPTHWMPLPEPPTSEGE